MRDAFKKGINLGLGLAAASKEQAEKVIDELMKKGELSQEESDDLFQQLHDKGAEAQKQLDQKMQQKLKEMLAELDVATKEDIKALDQRVSQLENKHINGQP